MTPVDRFEIWLHVRPEPFPVLMRKVKEFHIPFAVSLDRAAEIYRSADHPYTGTITETFSGFRGFTPQTTAMPPALNSANESPTFLKYHDCGGSKRGLRFGHGVAACTAAALDIKNPLRSSIKGTVGNIAEDRYLCTTVDPADIIRNTPFYNNLGAGHAHAAEPLAGSAFNRDLYCLASRPDASADAMLAFSNDMQFARTVSSLPAVSAPQGFWKERGCH